MLRDVVQVFVIQERDSGLFLSTELHWVRSLKAAGRCRDLDEAHDTARANTCEPYDVVSYFVAAV